MRSAASSRTRPSSTASPSGSRGQSVGSLRGCSRHEPVGPEAAPHRRGAVVVGHHVAAAAPTGRAVGVAGGPAHPRSPSPGYSTATWARDKLAVAAIEVPAAPSSQGGCACRVRADVMTDFLGEIPGQGVQVAGACGSSQGLVRARDGALGLGGGAAGAGVPMEQG